jgi:hypothetical protein
LYFFTINACRDTGCGATAGRVGVVVPLGVVAGALLGGGLTEADGVVGVALGEGAGDTASSVLQATAAVIANATTPVHAIRRSMSSSLTSATPEPGERSGNDCRPVVSGRIRAVTPGSGIAVPFGE